MRKLNHYKKISKNIAIRVLKVQMDQGEIRDVKTGRRVAQGHCTSPISFNLYSGYLSKKAPEGLRTGAPIINTVKYADDLVLLAKKGTILQGMTDRPVEFERRNGTEINAVNLR
jgi:hypothetical protein